MRIHASPQWWRRILIVATGVAGLCGAGYPYPFLNPDRYGWAGVGLWIVALAAAFLLVGAVLISVDRLRRPKMSTHGH